MNIKNSKILGTVKAPVLNRDAKARYLDHYCKVHEINIEDTATIGDGANDLAMLKAAGLGVAFGGKPFLQESIRIQLKHTDLRGLLYLQGFHQKHIVSNYTNEDN